MAGTAQDQERKSRFEFFIVGIIIIAVLLVIFFFITLVTKPFNVYPKDFVVNTDNVSKYVFVDGTVNEKNESVAYFFEDSTSINEINDIIDSAKIFENVSYGYMKESHYIDYYKYLYIYYKDGSKSVYTFYGKGSTIYKDPNGEYGKLSYPGSSLASYISNNGKAVVVDSNLIYLRDKEGFTFEKMFGPNYRSAWQGQ